MWRQSWRERACCRVGRVAEQDTGERMPQADKRQDAFELSLQHLFLELVSPSTLSDFFKMNNIFCGSKFKGKNSRYLFKP